MQALCVVVGSQRYVLGIKFTAASLSLMENKKTAQKNKTQLKRDR